MRILQTRPSRIVALSTSGYATIAPTTIRSNTNPELALPLCPESAVRRTAFITSATAQRVPAKTAAPNIAPKPSRASAPCFVSSRQCRYTNRMSIPTQPNIKLVNNPDYREHYANSVQVRVNVWDFFLVFGTMQQPSEAQVEVHNFEGIYLSPQQAKALTAVLQQNVANYESAFGEIKLDPRMTPSGPVH